MARVHTLGTGSDFLEHYRQNPSQYAESPVYAQRILEFYYHLILSDFQPHFTLLNPYTGANRDDLMERFTVLFRPFRELRMQSICLLLQQARGENWKIYKEFRLPCSYEA